MLSWFLGGLLLSLCGYYAFIAVPSMSNSNALSHEEVQSWVQTGRYFNFHGYSVFYRDSLGDALHGSSASPQEVVDRPVLLLLHGFPTFSFDYAELYPQLEVQGYHVVAVDLLGFGLSDKPHDVAYGFGMETDMVESLLINIVRERQTYRTLLHNSNSDGVLTESIRILAHDYSVSIAQEALARQLDRQLGHIRQPYVGFDGRSPSRLDKVPFQVGSVALLNGGVFPELHKPTVLQRLLHSPLTGPLIQLTSTYFTFASGLKQVFGPHTQPSDPLLHLFWDAICYKDGNLILHNLQQYITERAKNRDRLVTALVEGSKSVPIMFINGPADPVSGRHMAARFAELVPRASVHVLGDDIGHYPQIEAREDVLSQVVKFLAHNSL